MMNYKDNYKARLSDLTKTLHYVVRDFEDKFNLQIPEIGITTVTVTLKSGKKFNGFYRGSRPSYYRCSKELGIYVEFYKVKKDCCKSKIKTGVFIEEIQDIYHLPF